MNESDAKIWIDKRVSRETMERLDLYHDLLWRWQKTINLVAPSTLKSLWKRHFADSAQLYFLAPPRSGLWLDLGSGAGFPGMVVAAMAAGDRPDLSVTLVESDVRKSGFLREVARAMGLSVEIKPMRIGEMEPQAATVISARALASLDRLIMFAKPHMQGNCRLIFPKGANYADELALLKPVWQPLVEVHPSVTNPNSVILCLNQPGYRKGA